MMKKFLSLFLLSTLFLGAAACGNSQEEENTSTDTAQESREETADTAGSPEAAAVFRIRLPHWRAWNRMPCCWKDMLIAVPCTGIFLRDDQADGLLRAGVNAGQAGLTVSGCMYGFSVFHMNGCGRTDFLTDAAADACVTDFQKVLFCGCADLQVLSPSGLPHFSLSFSALPCQIPAASYPPSEAH